MPRGDKMSAEAQDDDHTHTPATAAQSPPDRTRCSAKQRITLQISTFFHTPSPLSTARFRPNFSERVGLSYTFMAILHPILHPITPCVNYGFQLLVQDV